ncbi:FKBP-type peptidyl-prolyl cis-trans isomerase [uncultured Hymenobacter sp.]|uniref:FKBP-type peptidyl-prolyl cis-trans isomerase n=1 Tax=uncultured Hymenobacter sp. TaxID=170016 RepID=UPI0035CAA1D5
MKNSFKRSLLFRIAAMLLVVSAPAFSSCEKDDTTQETAEKREQEYKIIDDGLIRAYLTRHGITEGSGINQYKRLSDATNDGIYLVSLSEGSGTTNIVSGNRVEVKYVGRFLRETNETTVFDNSTEKGIPCGCFPVTVGAGSVIKGWDEGLLQMKKGDRKLLLIPSYLGYGPGGQRDANGALIFPVDEPLLFDMTVLDVR